MVSPNNSFVHLHGHSHYSLLDGGAPVQRLCARAVELGMPALALTDHGNLFGLVDFYQEAKGLGLKPILGCELYVAPGSRWDRDAHGIKDAAYHLVVLAKNQTGYKHLLKLASLAYLEGLYYRPRVDKELLAHYAEGLIVMNGHLGTEIAACLGRNDLSAAVNVAGEYKEMFGRDFFIELQNHHEPAQVAQLPQLLEVARRAGCPVVATNDYHYCAAEDYEAHDVLCCISMGKTLDDKDRLHYSRQAYLKSPLEMRAIFKDWPEACDNTLQIADRCNLELDFSRRHAPVYTPPVDPHTGRVPSADDYLRQLCEQGLQRRYGQCDDTLRQRLEQELKVIQGKGFSSYFLIVWDFCSYARRAGIPAGARGSGVGTLVGYALGLCDVDPLRYDLLFERFMDPSRSEMPDIDIDICQEGRSKVIEYVRQKYGNVSQIITFSTLGAKAAIKDVGRVLGMPLSDVDKITKLIPAGLNVKLKNALQTADLKRLYQENPQVTRLIDIALRLEGLCRNAGMHAAGVIVCDKPIDEVVPLYKRGSDVMTQWDGPTCERAGLLKMDFLGLRTLTVLERALQLIEKDFAGGLPPRPAFGEGAAPAPAAHPAVPGRPGRIDLEKIDLGDARVYRTVFQCGRTKGVFQFESPGMRELLIKMKPDRIEDLIAANALFRPGPMELIPSYCARKHRRQPVPQVHPVMDKILAETYGIMVYQEQVMRIFNQLGDIPLARAYKIIKAISKKKTEIIAAEREHFIRGAIRNGISEAQAAQLFALIEEFGGYGFNKSHSTRYAIVAFQTAYLKTYFPLQYMAALLTFEMADQAKITEYIEECRFLEQPNGAVGVAILPPDINQSTADFTAVQGAIRFGLAAVKGVGQSAVEAIVSGRMVNGGPSLGEIGAQCNSVPAGEPLNPRARTTQGAAECSAVPASASDAPGGSGISPLALSSRLLRRLAAAAPSPPAAVQPFTSLYDFCERVDLRVMNKSVLESLIKCGAFDSLHANRAACLAAVEVAMQAGAAAQSAKRSGQESLFGNPDPDNAATRQASLPSVPEWSPAQKMAYEKAALGFYVTSHPLHAWQETLDDFTTLDSQTIGAAPERKEAIIGGLVTKVTVMTVRNGNKAGQKWATLLLDDLHGTMKVLVFSQEYQKYVGVLSPEAILFFRGAVDRSREEPSFRAAEIFTPQQTVEKLTRDVIFSGPIAALDEACLDRLVEVLRRHAGPRIGVKLRLRDDSHAPPLQVTVDLQRRINLTPQAQQELSAVLSGFSLRRIGPGSALAAARHAAGP